jgi:hypothetical protein
MGCGNQGCACCGGYTQNPASLTVTNLVGVNPCNQVLLKNGQTTGVFYFDFETGKVSVHDGSSARPICLPELRPLDDSESLAYMVGMTTAGCLVKIPITEENVTVCGGNILTVVTTSVTPP